MAGKWYDLDTASDILGISSDAVRKRIERGTLEGTKESGRWEVFIEDKRPEDLRQLSELVQQLKEENEYLKKQLDRKDNQIHEQNVIVLNLTEGIKLLEAPKPSLWERLFKRGDSE